MADVMEKTSYIVVVAAKCGIDHVSATAGGQQNEI